MGQEVFYSFDEVLRELQVEKDELNRLIEDGEIKAYSQGGQIKFLKKDVDTLRFSKMEQPTIAVHDREEIEIVDDMEDLEEEEEVVEKQNLFSQDWKKRKDDQESASASSFKGIERTSPLLNLSKEKESLFSFDDQDVTEKEGTDELEFENIGGDDLMDTGELLFDIKDNKLPGDKEVEELFPEHEDSSIKESHYHDDEITISKGEVEEEEDIIGVSEDFEEKDFPISSNKGQTWKIAGGIAALVLAFGSVASLLFPEILKSLLYGQKEVAVYRVSPKEVWNSYTPKEYLKPKTQIIYAQESGRIVNLAQTETGIEKDQSIASLAFPESIKKEISQLQNEQQTLNTAFEANKAAYKVIQAEDKKYLQENPVIAQYLDFQNRFRQSPNDLYKQQMERIKKENPVAMKGYGPIFNKKKNLVNELRSQQARLKSLPNEIAKKEQEFQKATIAILSPDKGIIKEWKVQENQEIQSGAALCILEYTSAFHAHFSIPKKEALDWKQGDTLSLSQEDQKGDAIISKVEEKDPGYISLEVLLEDNDSKIDQNREVSFTYSQKSSSLVIPQQSLSNGFVFMIKEGKAFRKNVQTGNKTENFVVIKEGLSEGDTIVAQYDETLKDGDSIIAK